jgi:outer membrane protein assembly factor BamB
MCAALAAAAGVAGGADADVMFLIENRHNVLWSVDVGRLEATEIGSLGVDWEFGGLAFARDGTLYAYNGLDNGLYTIDPATGAATLVGTDPEPYGLDTFDINPLTGEAIALDVNDEVWRLDLLTGNATFIANTSAPIDGTASAFGPDGTLYEANRLPDLLQTIDPATGQVTVVGPLGVYFDGTSMGFNFADNYLYAMSAPHRTDLLRIDPATGAAIELGPVQGLLGGNVQYTAATFLPAPAGVAVLSLAGLLASRRRR